MHLNSLLPAVVCAVLLAACATADQPPPAKPVASLAAMLTEAETTQKAGQNGRALMLLKQAAETYPAEKMPWLRMAQLRYETNSYGEAILSAQEVLERDPDDAVANSIVAVSGLRLASRALADLAQRNNLNGTVKSEAHDLAKLLKDALGEVTLVPRPAAKPREPKASSPGAPSAPAARKSSNSNDPFREFK
jgi:tetratricopeptide (TPR) repeat protein